MSLFALPLPGNLNTGVIDRDVGRGITKRIYIFGGAITAANYATPVALQAALKSASLLSRRHAHKLFSLPEIRDIADKTEANTEGSLNQGFKMVLLEGKPGYTFKLFAGSALARKLRLFNNQIVRILELDDNDKLWGTVSGTSVIGYTARLFFSGLKAATGQAVEEEVVTLEVSVLDRREYFDNMAYIDVSLVNMAVIKALHDVTIAELSKAANLHRLKLTIPTAAAGGFIDIYDIYPTLLAAAARFVAFAGVDFATSLIITSVVGNVPNKGYDLTLDNTAAGPYALLASGAPILINLASPASLDAADVVDIEGVALITSKP